MTTEDLLDLEWLLEQDRQADPAAILARDRAIGLEALSRGLPADAAFWLAWRRRTERQMPSAVLGPVRRVLAWALFVGGAFLGVSVVRALLCYSGSDPVNVSVFLLVAVFSQAGLALVTALLLMIQVCLGHGPRLPWWLSWQWPAPRSRTLTGLERMMTFFQGAGQRGLLRLLAWQGLVLAQLGALGLALGSLGAMLGSVAVTDLAFGWQSTLSIGAEGMFRLAKILALPWSWLPDAAGAVGLVPDLAQIQGSRIVLKDGISTLTSSDLAAWWPFLGMCLAVYAVLPRLILLTMARICLRRQERLFVHPDLDRIASRMAAPLLGTPGASEPASTPLPLAPVRIGDKCPEHGTGAATVGAVLILPPELDGRIPEAALGALVSRACGYPLGQIVLADLDPEGMRQVRCQMQCQNLAWTGGHARYVVLIEAWQPPIRESLNALQMLGDQPGCSLILALTGRPVSGNWLTAPGPTDTTIWTEALERLAPLRASLVEACA